MHRATLAALLTLVLASAPAPAAAADLLVGNTQSRDVVRYDADTGDYRGVFIPAGTGGLLSPDDFLLDPDGLLYLTSGANDATPGQGVLRFDPRTGAFIDHFTKFPDGQNRFIRPYGAAFGPDGLLYVASFRTDEILRFDGRTGDFIDVFARGLGEADGLNGPNDLLFTPAGRLLVTTQGSVAARDGTGAIAYRFPSQILDYDPATGAHRVFATPGPRDDTDPPSGFSSLLGLATASDGAGFHVTDFANGLLHYAFTGELLGVTSTRTGSNQAGNLALHAGQIYVPVFNAKTLEGAILRLPEAGTETPAQIWVDDPNHLRRPVGVFVLPSAP
jgi:sugar lactone lactonase YvrE